MRVSTRSLILGLLVPAAIVLPVSGTWSVPLASPALPPPGTPLTIDLFRNVARQQNPVVVSIITRARVTARLPEDDVFEWFFGFRSEPGSRMERSLGSGFIISRTGEILTNDHVVAGAESIEVALFGDDGTTYRAAVIGRDPLSDSALIKLDQPPAALPAATLGDSDAIAPGDWVMAIGNPFELGHTVTVGVVSYQGRPFQVDEGRWQNMIQIDASINPGNSGGPLLNVRGEVIGLNAAILDGSAGGNIGIGFAVPINAVKALLPQLRTGKVVRGHIGVHARVGCVTAKDATALGLTGPGGAIVAAVERDSPAQRAGLRAGDVMIALDDTPLRDADDFVRRISAAPPGSPLAVTIQRNGRSQTLRMIVDELQVEDSRPRPAAPERPGDVGARFADVTASIARQLELPAGVYGAVVYDVSPDSAADRAGLTRGDVDQRDNRLAVRPAADAARALAGVEAGGSVFVLVWRGGDEVLLQMRE
jgi:serine protease Do